MASCVGPLVRPASAFSVTELLSDPAWKRPWYRPKLIGPDPQRFDFCGGHARKVGVSAQSYTIVIMRGDDMAEDAALTGEVLRTAEFPDDTPIERVPFSTRVRNVLAAAGLKTVGEVREVSDSMLLAFHDFGPGSLATVRQTLGRHIPAK